MVDSGAKEIEITAEMIEAATDYAFRTGYLPEPTEDHIREILTGAYRIMYGLRPANS